MQKTSEDGSASAAVPAHIILTVHGTNDSDPGDEGARWWQRGSAFSARLLAELAKRGVSAEIAPVHWSGANSDFERTRAAVHLAELIRKLRTSGRAYAVVAHSPGGNVVMEALGYRGSEVASVATFGTPFLIKRLKVVPLLVVTFSIVFGGLLTLAGLEQLSD